MLHFASTLVLVLIGLGLYYRRQPGVHLRLMTSAFLIDLFLVIYIETTRGAVEAVVTRGKGLVWFHAGVSVAVLMLYVAQLTLGWQMLAKRQPALAVAGTAPPVVPGGSPHRVLHRNLGITFCVLRLLNYVTAFML